MSTSKTKNWKELFINTNQFDYLNNNIVLLRESIDPSAEFLKNFEEISKNPGVCFLALDPSKSKLQLFHHPKVIGGSWKEPNKRMIAFIDFDFDANPVEIVQKSIKEVKGKSHSTHEFNLGCDDPGDFQKLRNPKLDYHSKNIVPLPSMLVKTFLELTSTTPTDVAIAFVDFLYHRDEEVHTKKTNMSNTKEEKDMDESGKSLQDQGYETEQITNSDPVDLNQTKFFEDCLHIIQFCHLWAIGKVKPVLFMSLNSAEAKAWKSSILTAAEISPKLRLPSLSKHRKPDDESDNESTSSPANKLTKRDDTFISTMMKIHESVDKTLARSNSEREEREPGFKKLEPHKKQFILNASTPPPYDTTYTEPTEFYSQFLSKKSQFKAKEMLLYKLSTEDIAFNPNANFVSCLWNCELLWILPDIPSGISIFFCPDSKSMNASELPH